MPDTESLENFAETRATLVIHLSIHNLTYITKTLIPIYGADCPVAIVYRASWPDQQIIKGVLCTIEKKVPKEMERTAIIFIGKCLDSNEFNNSRLYTSDYVRRFRPKAAQGGKEA